MKRRFDQPIKMAKNASFQRLDQNGIGPARGAKRTEIVQGESPGGSSEGVKPKTITKKKKRGEWKRRKEGKGKNKPAKQANIRLMQGAFV